MNKRCLGDEKEQAAIAYLQQRGYQIVQRNFRCRTGEIDVIARDGVYLCFVEVKYRRNLELGYPEDAVNSRKQQKIINTAHYYRMIHKLPEDTSCRFDVVVMLEEKIKLIQNAFELSSLF